MPIDLPVVSCHRETMDEDGRSIHAWSGTLHGADFGGVSAVIQELRLGFFMR
jgi:hypothetical protein